jgi:hypothetical protein
VSSCRPWFLWPETKKLVIPFLRIYLFDSLLAVHLYPQIGDLTNLAGYPPLNQISSFVITSLTTTYCWEWIINSRKIARRCQHWRIQVSLQGKIFPVSIYRLFARGRATSKHGGGGRYNAILEFKGEQIKNSMRKKKNIMRKIKKERKKEREIWEKEKEI